MINYSKYTVDYLIKDSIKVYHNKVLTPTPPGKAIIISKIIRL